MPLPYALLTGLLFGISLYLLLRRSIIDEIFGLILLSHAANLIVFGSGRLTRGSPPLLDGDANAIADPLPQALVLTAIVISFGLIAFAVALVSRMYDAFGTEDGELVGEAADD